MWFNVRTKYVFIFLLNRILNIYVVGFLAATAEQYAETLSYIVGNSDLAQLRDLRERARYSCKRFSDEVFETGMTAILNEGYI